MSKKRKPETIQRLYPMRKANDQVLEKTVEQTGESAALIQHAISFQFGFIGDKITEGSYESIMIAGFGRFQPKVRSVQWKHAMKSLPPNLRKMVKK